MHACGVIYLFIYLLLLLLFIIIIIIIYRGHFELCCQQWEGLELRFFGRKGVGSGVGGSGVRALREICKLRKFRENQIRAAPKIFGSRLRTS